MQWYVVRTFRWRNKENRPRGFPFCFYSLFFLLLLCPCLRSNVAFSAFPAFFGICRPAACQKCLTICSRPRKFCVRLPSQAWPKRYQCRCGCQRHSKYFAERWKERDREIDKSCKPRATLWLVALYFFHSAEDFDYRSPPQQR